MVADNVHGTSDPSEETDTIILQQSKPDIDYDRLGNYTQNIAHLIICLLQGLNGHSDGSLESLGSQTPVVLGLNQAQGKPLRDCFGLIWAIERKVKTTALKQSLIHKI